MRNFVKYELKYATYMLHICDIIEICNAEMLKNAIEYVKYVFIFDFYIIYT